MKSKETVTNIVDAVAATIQSILFAVLPFIFSTNSTNKPNTLTFFASFFVLLVFYLVFLFFFKNKLIAYITKPNGIVASEIRDENIPYKFRRELLPIVEGISKSSNNSRFEDYYSYIKWYNAVEFLKLHFLSEDDNLINVDMQSDIYYGKQVGAWEVLIVAQELCNIYRMDTRKSSIVNRLFSSSLAKNQYEEIRKIIVMLEKKDDNPSQIKKINEAY